MADRDAGFTAYVTTRRRMLIRTAYLLCGDHARAEDLVQTTLAKLYVAWPRMRSEEPDAYARRVLVNAYRDEGRRPWRREAVMAETPEQSVGEIDLGARDEIVRALRQLPIGQRRAVVLRHLWGLSVEEVADDLDRSVGTVKSQTADGLRRLRALLTADLESEGIRR